MTKFKSLLFIAVLAGFAVLAHAGFKDGKAAYDRGDYARAYKGLSLWRTRDRPEAQYILGLMYLAGQGVPQDYARGRQMVPQGG